MKTIAKTKSEEALEAAQRALLDAESAYAARELDVSKAAKRVEEAHRAHDADPSAELERAAIDATSAHSFAVTRRDRAAAQVEQARAAVTSAAHAIDVERASALLSGARDRAANALAQRKAARAGLVGAASELGRAMIELSRKADEHRAQVGIVDTACATAEAELRAEEDRFLVVAPERGEEIARVRAERAAAELAALVHLASPAGFRERAFDAFIASPLAKELQDRANERIADALKASHAAAVEARQRGALDVRDIDASHVQYGLAFSAFMSKPAAERDWTELATKLGNIINNSSHQGPPGNCGLGSEIYAKVVLDTPLGAHVEVEIARRARDLGTLPSESHQEYAARANAEKRRAIIEADDARPRSRIFESDPVDVSAFGE